jgi:hypothetical protein
MQFQYFRWLMEQLHFAPDWSFNYDFTWNISLHKFAPVFFKLKIQVARVDSITMVIKDKNTHKKLPFVF